MCWLFAFADGFKGVIQIVEKFDVDMPKGDVIEAFIKEEIARELSAMSPTV